MKKLAIIANKKSGREAAVAHTLSARSELWGRKCEFYFPETLTELKTVCASLSPKHYESLVVIGGDGTVNQVIRSIPFHPNPIPLFPFPGGTANDFAKELGLAGNWHQVQTLIDQKSHDLIDLIEINGFPFATVGGIGIGAILTEEFNKRRCQSTLFKSIAQMLHFQMYTAMSAKTILLRRDYLHHLHIRGAGFDERIKTPAVFFCNQAFLGGNMKVAPSLDNTDKRFNVLIVTHTSRTRLLSSMIELKRGKLPPHFLVFSTDRLTITDLNQKKLSVFGDGEPLTEASTLEVKILPKTLKVYRDSKRYIQ